jgi:type IV secretory pathway protease TraF
VDAAALERLADHVLRAPAVVTLVGEDVGPAVDGSWRRRDGRPVPVAQAERRFTTRELLATERRVLDSAEQARSERSVVPVAVVDRVLARRGARR